MPQTGDYTAQMVRALPLTGGVMTGSPYFGNKKKFITWHENDVGFIASDAEGTTGDSTRLMVGNKTGFDLARALWLSRWVNGIETQYRIYGEHNKPTAADVGAVSKSGDTMTGNLTVERSESPSLQVRHTASGRTAVITESSQGILHLYTQKDNNNYQYLRLKPETDALSSALTLIRKVSGNETTYDILHTGNKPSGSYTGNGDATERVINTGGIGHAVMITSAYSWLLVRSGGLGISSYYDGVNGVVTFPYAKVRFRDGVLTLNTADDLLNGNGRTYEYQVL